MPARLAIFLLAALLPWSGAAGGECLNESDPAGHALPEAVARLPNPVLFVTQMPLGADMQTRMSAFGHHGGQPSSAGRGGDLWLLHPPSAGHPAGCLRNLTREAGFGDPGVEQGEASIAVREPTVHWSGTRALFSMVQGAPRDGSAAELARSFHWQVFEVTGLGVDQQASIARLPHQPPDYNNVSPIYAPGEDAVLFTSDIPVAGPDARHLYPPRDEYELLPTTDGLWRLDLSAGVPDGQRLQLLTHNPSGVFTPLVDSFGRVLLVSWDHLQRDIYQFGLNGQYSWNLASEAPGAPLSDNREYFPDPIDEDNDPLALVEDPELGRQQRHDIKLFFPWELTALDYGAAGRVPYANMEILNHLGRHQLAFFLHARFQREGNGLQDFTHPRGREGSLDDGTLYIAEDPLQPGRFVFADGQHFQKNGSGPLWRMDAPPGQPPHLVQLERLTGDDTGAAGRYRDPLPLSNGELLAVHTTTTADTRDLGAVDPGTGVFISQPNYVFRLRLLDPGASDPPYAAGPVLLPALSRTVEMHGARQGARLRYGGAFSQLDPVEVLARPDPGLQSQPLAPQDAALWTGDRLPRFLAYLRRHGLAVLASRDVTSRDGGDRQQPFNLFVQDHPDKASFRSVDGVPVGDVHGVQYLQLFQGDMVRINGHEGVPDGGAPPVPPSAPRPGRRVLAVPLHAAAGHNPPFVDAAAAPAPADARFRRSAVHVAEDGSVAAFVPARRALSWQLTDAGGRSLVNERYWLTLQPGEIRVCDSCHGVDHANQAGQPPPQHAPLALARLVAHWETVLEARVFRDGFER